jgi:ubiquinol-cytochrome c reductase iron-sulfur subunit
MRKQLALIGIVVMALVGVAALAWMFASSMSISATTREIRGTDISAAAVAAIEPGEVAEFLPFGRPLFVLRPTPDQLRAVVELDEHVWNHQWSGYDADHGLFIYWGISTRLGCNLEHIPPGASPLGVGVGGRWLGGYFDPCHDSSYDYAGRTIKSFPYSRNGFTADVPNLQAPDHRFRSDGTLVIYLGAS